MMHKSNKQIQFVTALLVLLLLCAIPLIPGLYSDSKTKVIVEPTNLGSVSVNDEKISQEIYLQGQLQDISVYVDLSNRVNPKGTVTVTLDQGDLHVIKQIKLSKLISGNYNEVGSGFSKFIKGSAILSITADSTNGTQVNCATSGTLISGLPAAASRGKSLNGPLAIQYNILKYNHYFVYDTVLFAMLLFVLLLTAWLLTYKKELLGKKNYLFFCSFAIIFIAVSLNNPTASFYGQPISEAAYEFWYKAHESGFIRSMMSLMSREALAWLERIMIYIADKLSPDKYVFVIAQVIELAFISAVTSLVSLKSFRRYFCDEVRLLFCVFMGSLVFFTFAYYFYGVSYWSAFFFIAFMLMDLDSLKKWQYWGGVLLTVVLCVSRIYHVILIPVCIFLLIVLGKRRSKRFRLLNGVMIVASTFEGLWTAYVGGKAMSNEGFLQNILDMGILRLINNTFYYQVQVLNSLFTHQANNNALLSNMMFLLLIIGIIVAAVYGLVSQKHDNTIPAVTVALGMFSMGTIAVNVITSGNWASISFPISYSAKVSWTSNYYQQADFHFSYAYICTAFLLMLILYVIKSRWLSVLTSSLILEKPALELKVIRSVGCVAFSAVILLLGSEVAHNKVSARWAPTEWQAVYDVTVKDSYYIPVNVDYPVATISLTHNSYCMMFGYLSNGKFGRWVDGDSAYSNSILYSNAILGDGSDLESHGLLSICARKALTNFETTYVAVLYDRKGNVLARIPQAESTDRVWIDFMLDKPRPNVYSVSFELSSGERAYVNNALQLGVSMYAIN